MSQLYNFFNYHQLLLLFEYFSFYICNYWRVKWSSRRKKLKIGCWKVNWKYKTWKGIHQLGVKVENISSMRLNSKIKNFEKSIHCYWSNWKGEKISDHQYYQYYPGMNKFAYIIIYSNLFSEVSAIEAVRKLILASGRCLFRRAITAEVFWSFSEEFPHWYHSIQERYNFVIFHILHSSFLNIHKGHERVIIKEWNSL